MYSVNTVIFNILTGIKYNFVDFCTMYIIFFQKLTKNNYLCFYNDDDDDDGFFGNYLSYLIEIFIAVDKIEFINT